MCVLVLTPQIARGQAIAITNDADEPIHISVGVSKLASAPEERSAATWLLVDKQHLEVAPGESEEVLVTIRIPKDAPSGGFFAAVHLQAGTSPTEVGPGMFGGGTGVGADVISSFMITVRGEDPAELTLQGVVAKIVPVAKGKDRLGFRVEIENTGNVHFVPKGEVELRDVDGKVIGKLSLQEGVPVIPGTTRSYDIKGSLDVLPDNYTASATVDYSWEEWQADVVEADPEEWSGKEATDDLVFNSEPKLRIKTITPVIQDDGTIRTDVEVENLGDVEVAPQGYLDVLTTAGDRAFAFNLGNSVTRIEPGSSSTASATYTGVMPKGDYTVKAVMNYHGEDETQKAEFIHIQRGRYPSHGAQPA